MALRRGCRNSKSGMKNKWLIKKRILVFTSIERAFYSPVIEYQLLEPIVEVSKSSKNKFIYVGLIPITFWFSREAPLESFILYKRNRKKIRQLLVGHGIHCSFIPILFPLRHKDFYLRIPWLILYILNTLPLLLYFILYYKINLIHARNYPASLLCFLSRCILGTPYNFDMRDLYPEKGIEAGVFGKLKTHPAHKFMCRTWSYKLWKFIELNLLRSASSIIVTSIPFYEYVKSKIKNHSETSSGSKIKIIPNSVNTKRFRADSGKKKEEMKAKYGLTNKFVLIHSGAFGTPQDITVVGKYFLKWKNLYTQKPVHLVILCGTKKYLPHIREVLEGIGILKEDYTLINPKFSDIPNLLLLGDIGLHLETMALATPYCIAVKDGEYLASGLPVIATPWLKGIAGLIEKYNAGIVVDPLNEDYTSEKKLLEKYETIRKNGLTLVKEHLSLDNCVKKFFELYQ